MRRKLGSVAEAFEPVEEQVEGELELDLAVSHQPSVMLSTLWASVVTMTVRWGRASAIAARSASAVSTCVLPPADAGLKISWTNPSGMLPNACSARCARRYENPAPTRVPTSAFIRYLAPDAQVVADALVYPATIGEFWMIGFLLIRGVRHRALDHTPPNTRTPASAAT
ncbi:hypothetical protein ABGB16_12210 [Micromonospora sp. B11E3]|uniref:hypothetical protein n=1 Tax=Micromonospora sp. B11E3 TaxID=3153562 RepID=UPI00325E86B1